MSLTGPGVAGLPLFGGPAPEPVREVHRRFEVEEATFLERVRWQLAHKHAGTGRGVTTDDAHFLMARAGIEIPAGCSPNVMGTLFSGWDRARDTGNVVRSQRAGAGGNYLKVWLIE